MKRTGTLLTILVLLAFYGTGFAGVPGMGTASTAKAAIKPETLAKPDPAVQAKLVKAYGKIPLAFEANAGQTDKQVKFLTRGAGYSLFLTPTESVAVLSKRKKQGDRRREAGDGILSSPSPLVGEGRGEGEEKLQTAVIRMKLAGANADAVVSGQEILPGKSNYFTGNDPKQWRTGVAQYKKVHYREVYSGIDLLYYGNQSKLEYDFIVKPGADYKNIQLDFAGADTLTIDAKGDLILHTKTGDVVQKAPVIYQEVDGARQNIDGHYLLQADNRVAFHVAEYDRDKPLVIDPVLLYSTYLGGSGDDKGIGITVDAVGNAYVTGRTFSTNFPTTAGAVQITFGGFEDAFVTKLSADGSALDFSTYLGGNSRDWGNGIAVDTSGNAYVTGWTQSTNFPTTAGAFQTIRGGSFQDAFVTKLSADGSALVYSTYLGGSGVDDGQAITVDAVGNAYVTGFTNSTDFPTAGAVQTVKGRLEDAFVTKLSADGSALDFSTYLGGSGFDEGLGVTVDAGGNAYVTGRTFSTNFPTTAGAVQTVFGGGLEDAFVTKLSIDGSALDFSTYLGGNNRDQGLGITVDASGAAYVTGWTRSTNFPTTAGAVQTVFGGGLEDAFVTKLSIDGSALDFSTYLGGNNQDQGRGIAVDATGNAYVTGRTGSTNFPTAGAVQTVKGRLEDAFVTKLSADGSALDFSTYLGGNSRDWGNGIAVDTSGNAYVTGRTFSTNFPTTTGAVQTVKGGRFDAFIAKIGVFPLGLDITVAVITLNPPDGDRFKIKGILTLDPASDGIDLLTDIVTVTLGGFSVNGTIGMLDASGIRIKIRADGRFEIKAKDVNLGPLTSPAPFSLRIGNDGGMALVPFN